MTITTIIIQNHNNNFSYENSVYENDNNNA